MINRYELGSEFPQPVRKISPESTDILHTLKMGERLDNLAYKWYSLPLCGYIIMCANPEFENEFEIPVGTQIRIPMPLDRILKLWKIEKLI